MHGDFLTQPHHIQKRTLLFVPFDLKGEMCILAWFTSVMNKNTELLIFYIHHKIQRLSKYLGKLQPQ
jgi:hypothetical protein